jgi:hypothetical protein
MPMAIPLLVIAAQVGIASLGLTALTTAILTAGVALLGTVATMLLTPTPAKPKMEDGKQVLKQAIPPRIRVYGRWRAGGASAYFDNDDNGNLLNVIMHASHKIAEFEAHWLADETVPVDGSGRVTSRPYHTDGKYYVELVNYLGDDNQTVSAFLPDDEWTDTGHRLQGIASTVIKYSDASEKEQYKIFPQGAVAYSTTMKGALVYDPRNGAHDINDEDTWTWTDNAALILLDYLTRKQQGVAVGFGFEWDEINIPSFITAANVSDEFIALRFLGGSERRWRIWGAYELTEDRKAVLGDMLTACCGRLVQGPDGKVRLDVGKESPPSGLTLTDDQFKGWNLKPGVNAIDRVNGIRATFINEANKWGEIEAAIHLNQASIDQNGEEFTDLKLRFVPSETQAQRISKYMLKRGDPKFSGDVTGTLALMNAWGERFATLDLEELVSFSGMYEVNSVSLDRATMMVTLSISSYDDWWTWNPAVDELDPSLVPDRPAHADEVSAPVSVTTSVVSRNLDGKAHAAIGIVTWPAPPKDTWTSEVWYRPITIPVSDWIRGSPPFGIFYFETDALKDGQAYQAQVRYVATMGSVSEFTLGPTFTALADPVAPAAPVLFTAQVVGTSVNLTAYAPNDAHFGSMSFYRGLTNVFGAATLIAGPYIGGANQRFDYVDSPPPGDYYYFARTANWSNIPGTPTAGQLAEPAPAPPRILSPSFTSYDTTQVINGDQAYPSSLVQLYVNGVINSSTTASPSGIWSLTTAALPVGGNMIVATSKSGTNESGPSGFITGTITALDTDAAAIIAAITAEPTSARMGLINDLVIALKAAGVWAKLDVLYLLAAADSQASRLNWKAPTGSYNLTATTITTAPTFTADRSWKGGGAGATAGGILTQAFNPATASSPKFVQDDSHMMVYTRAASTASANNLWREIGAAGASYIATKNATATNMGAQANAAAFDLTAVGGVTGVGMFAWSRQSSANYHMFKNATDLGTTVRASVAPSNAAFTLCRAGGGYSDAELSAASWGSGLTAVEMAALYTAVTAYLTAVGAI